MLGNLRAGIKCADQMPYESCGATRDAIFLMQVVLFHYFVQHAVVHILQSQCEDVGCLKPLKMEERSLVDDVECSGGGSRLRPSCERHKMQRFIYFFGVSDHREVPLDVVKNRMPIVPAEKMHPA